MRPKNKKVPPFFSRYNCSGYKTLVKNTLREMVITSVLDENPPCLVVGGYTRHHLSDEPHGQNLLALEFEMSH